MNRISKLSCALASVTMAALASTSQAQVAAGPITNPANGHRYYVIQIANYLDFNLAAQNLGGYPVAINDATENAWILTNLMPSVPATFDYAYIGLSDEDREGEWRWEVGVTDRYTNWAAGEPNNQLNEDFGSMRRTGQWNDRPAPVVGGTLPYAFVEVGGGTLGEPAGIYAGPICDPASGNEYYVLTGSLIGSARAFAQSHLGGDLVTIDSAAENEFLARHLAALPNLGSYIHIGLRDSAVEGVFTWASGSTATYRRWFPGEPNNFNDEDYVVMATAAAPAGELGGWFDTDDANRPTLVEVVRCRGDFNKSGDASVQDIFDFLAAYFSGCP